MQVATLPINGYTLDEYLGAEDDLGCRSEFHDGIVLPVEPATLKHSSLSLAMGSMLR